jgi:ribosomal protein L22
MSADDETTAPQDGPTPAEPDDAKALAAKKPAAAKKAAADKPAATAAQKKAAAKKPAAEKKATAGKKPVAEKKAAAEKKPAAEKKSPAKEESAAASESATAERAGGKHQASGRSATKKRLAKKAASAEAAAPGDAAEAKELAKVQATSKPAEKLARRAAAAGKAPRRRLVSAHARYVRTSARKARMVCGHLRGKSVQEARAILAFTPREVARDWSKLLESAVANAESNHELLEDDLIVREAYADEGPTIKRFRPRAMGRATQIRKRTSHLTITLTPRPESGTNKRNR